MTEIANDKTGTEGWDFPISFSKSGVKMTNNEMQDVRKNLEILFRTSLGEVKVHQDLGCDFQGFIFENINNSLFSTIRDRIVSNVLRYENRAIIESIDVSRDDNCYTKIIIDVGYRLREEGTVQSSRVAIDNL